MAKLYPPKISSTIPAFAEGTVLTVPFSMNKAVAASEVKGFILKIKDVNGDLIDTIEDNYFSYSDNIVRFNFPGATKGQYYKIQLAYKDQSDSVGYYSTVGVVKCTGKPEVTIVNLKPTGINHHIYNYVGKYKQDLDPTEKMYSFRFKIIDSNGKIFQDSGEIIHNTINDTLPNESQEEYILSKEFDTDDIYFLQFEVTTINGLKVSSPKYRVIKQNTVPSEYEGKIELIATNNFEEGYIELKFQDKMEVPTILNGLFLISRKSDKEFNILRQLKRIDLDNKFIDALEPIKDYAVEQGVTYTYVIQQYNQKGLYSNPIESEPVMADFEDVFLYDGERQLKVRFNPKIASFKRNILESKTDTIGSKYPYFSRNGNVNYKEFSLNGLISYKMDEAKEFIDLGKSIINHQRESTPAAETYIPSKFNDLVAENYKLERDFKLAVYDFLTDGKPKLLKTAPEGNYIVRLMNTSFAPIDTVGRLLHSFSSTAYEIANNDFEAMSEYKFIDYEEHLKTKSYVQVQSIISESVIEAAMRVTDSNTLISLLPEGSKLYTIDLRDLIPGTIFYLEMNGEEKEIMIGSTGAYYFTTDIPITDFKMSAKDLMQLNNLGINPQLTYNVVTTDSNSFTEIDTTVLKEYPLIQIIGNQYLKELEALDKREDNLLNSLFNIREEVLKIYMIRFKKRKMQYLYIKPENVEEYIGGKVVLPMGSDYNYYEDMYGNKRINNLEPYLIYKLRTTKGNYDSDYLEMKWDFALEDEDTRLFKKQILDRYNIYVDGYDNQIFYVEKSSNVEVLDDNYVHRVNEYDNSKSSILTLEEDNSTYLNEDDIYKVYLSFDGNINEEIDLKELERYTINSIDFNLKNFGIKSNFGVVTELSCIYQEKFYAADNELTIQKLKEASDIAKNIYLQAVKSKSIKSNSKKRIQDYKLDYLSKYKLYLEELEKFIVKGDNNE